MSKDLTVWRHKKKGTLYIITGQCKSQYFGVWKPAFLYQEIVPPHALSADQSITMKPGMYCRPLEDFNKKFIKAGAIQQGEGK